MASDEQYNQQVLHLADPTIGDAVVDLPVEQSEIIFMGTGTSEGIPRVSCLTNPLKKCLVLVLNFHA